MKNNHILPEEHLTYMGYVKPQYRKSRVDEAGVILITPNISQDLYDKALEVVDNWRTSHNFPLNTLQMSLRRNAKKIDNNAIVAQRIKRLFSIKHKLQQSKKITLSEMQDIGGCRAIVKDIDCINGSMLFLVETPGSPKIFTL